MIVVITMGLFLGENEKALLSIIALEDVFRNLGPVLQKRTGNHRRLVDHRLLEIAVFSQHGEAFLAQAPAEDAVQQRSVDDAVFHGLTLDRLVADSEHGGLITLRVEAELFEPKHAHPGTAADTGNTDFLAA
ncbi:MAG TPA: hypothetical protein VMT22_18725 [Terriglobales bacterium]|nr:hypothetical protein [Terriglobales bacterium]